MKLYKGFALIVRANGLWLSTGKMQKNFHHATHLIAVVTPQGRLNMSKIIAIFIMYDKFQTHHLI